MYAFTVSGGREGKDPFSFFCNKYGSLAAAHSVTGVT